MTRPIPVPTEPADIAALLHEAVVYGHIRDGSALVIGRRRPFIPAGADPADVNRECARRYVISTPEWACFIAVEVDPADVVPFLDVAARLEAADVHANRAQQKNVKGAK
jgi:hypothetical protein